MDVSPAPPPQAPAAPAGAACRGCGGGGGGCGGGVYARAGGGAPAPPRSSCHALGTPAPAVLGAEELLCSQARRCLEAVAVGVRMRRGSRVAAGRPARGASVGAPGVVQAHASVQAL